MSGKRVLGKFTSLWQGNDADFVRLVKAVWKSLAKSCQNPKIFRSFLNSKCLWAQSNGILCHSVVLEEKQLENMMLHKTWIWMKTFSALKFGIFVCIQCMSIVTKKGEAVMFASLMKQNCKTYNILIYCKTSCIYNSARSYQVEMACYGHNCAECICA